MLQIRMSIDDLYVDQLFPWRFPVDVPSLLNDDQ